MPPLPTFPARHALRSSFAVPPLDGTLTVPELYDWHLAHNPAHVLWRFSHPSSSDDTCGELTFKDGVHAIHRAARLFTERFTAQGVHPATHDAPVIALFAATDTITYFLCWLGLVRAGYVVCHISPRNSAAALAHILRAARAARLLVSPDPGVQAVARDALSNHASPAHKDEWKWEEFVSEMPVHSDVIQEGEVELMPPRVFDLDARAYYIHSSGTTAFPKPISWTHRDFLVFSFSLLLSDHDFAEEVLACHSIPMFHGLGVLTTLIAACCGMTLSAFAPAHPATPLAPDTVFASAMRTRSTYLFCVPLFIEIWSRDPAKVDALANIKGILYGGGPLNKAVGDFMTAHGVDVYVTYGASENGMKAVILPPPPGMDWEYFRIAPQYRAEFVPYGDGTYELVTIKCATHSPLVFNTTWDGAPAYATSDLLVPHPTKEGFWKVFGRADDQIMLSTGEKTNPGPLESILCQDARVQAAVMFGRGRFQNGVIVQPKAEYAFDPAEEDKLSEFRNAIWPTVERMNAYAPQHSRLFKEMILIMKPGKPFQYTAKGSVRRLAVIGAYEREIEGLYAAVEETAQGEIEAPPRGGWSEERVGEFVGRTVRGVMRGGVGDEDDLFQYGCDSLQATWIRNTLARALREAGAVRALPADVVYSYPTIKRLAGVVRRLAEGEGEGEGEEGGETRKEKVEAMWGLVEKYARDLPEHKASSKYAPGVNTANGVEGEDGVGVRGGDIVLVTGTTGGLGTSMLAELAGRAGVARVYALNRKSVKGSETLAERQRRALAERGLDAGIVDAPKVVLLEGDMTLPSLGLEEDVLDEMRGAVTVVIHNAWRVDFNLSLASFETQLVILRNLVDFALASTRAAPPAIVFTSSVGVLRNAALTSPALETALPDPAVALGAGYSESKWVAEQVLQRVAAARGVRTVVVRVGQLSGTRAGAWNKAEWLPALVASGPALGCLPALEAEVAWIPLEAAARAMAEIAHNAVGGGKGGEGGGEGGDGGMGRVLHLAHPRPVAWAALFAHVAARVRVPLVPYGEWLARMEASVRDTGKTEVQHMRENPALRLLAFYKGGRVEGREGYEAMGFPMMDMARAREAAPSLEEVECLGEEDVERWVAYWRRVGLLDV